MNVRDLISVLSDYPEDTDVMISTNSMFDYEDVNYAVIADCPYSHTDKKVVIIS